MSKTTFNSFRDLAKHMHAQDVARADKLRRSAPLRKGKAHTRTGPAVAR
jgi:hypothetical protein